MGEHERGAAVVVELVQELVDLGSIRDGGGIVSFLACEGRDPLLDPSAPAPTAGCVRARPAGDREQPMLRRPGGAVPVQGGERPLVGLLGEVVGVVAVTEVSTDRHHVVLGLGHETLQRIAVAPLGVQQEPGEVIHGGSVCRGNQTVTRADRHFVEPGLDRARCVEAREMISAAADDELTHTDEQRLAEHLEHCDACRGHADRLTAMTRVVRLRAVAVEPDFVERVMVRVPTVRLGRGAWLRPALAWCGVVIAAYAVRPLFFADLDGTPTHVARHVGASALALAVGLLYVAWRPHRALGLLPLVGALIATTAVGTVLDTVSGDRSPLAESVHLVELVGMTLLWMVAGSPGWERVRAAVGSLRRGVVRPTN